MNPEHKERYNYIQKTIAAGKDELSRMKPILEKYKEIISTGATLDEKNKAYFIQLTTRMKEISEEEAELTPEFEELRKELLAGQHAKIIVKRDIFPGVEINISDTILYVKDQRSFTSIERKNGEIVFSPL